MTLFELHHESRNSFWRMAMNRCAWVVGLAVVVSACATSVNVEQEKAALMQTDILGS